MKSDHPIYNAGLSTSWRASLLLTLLTVYLLVLMEWIFFATKPSFLSVLGWPQQAMVLGLAPLPFLIVAGLVQGPIVLVGILVKAKQPRRILRIPATLLPAGILGALYLLLVDNFTNTVWGLAIQKVNGVLRGLLVLLVAGLFFLAWRSAIAWQDEIQRHLRRWAGLGGVLLAISMGLLAVVLVRMPATGGGGGASLYPALAERPNILILGSDGLNANHLSAYGYELDTTPVLNSLLESSLVCENNFANCSHTTGSLASLLTGRLPTETGVTYPPDILSGRDAYRHLPGVLKKLGYNTSQISIRHYGDAYDVNLRDGFDTANFRRREVAQAASRLGRYLGQEPSYFVEQIQGRLVARLAHVAGRKQLGSAFQESVHADRLAGLSEERRFQGLMQILHDTSQPFFAHAHFMGTHGTRFYLRDQVFSAGLTQDRDWMMPFYDDAIREFDLALGRFLEVMQERGILENTIVVIYSDHGMGSDSRHRTPLVIRFPQGNRAGRLTGNTQCLDITPTILDYLGTEVPVWLHGQSLLAGEPDPLRPVFSTRFRSDTLKRVVPGGPFQTDTSAAGPPFYSMGSLIMVIAQRVYSLDLVKQELKIHDLPDHSAPRPEQELPDAAAAEAMLIEHLVERGFDASGLTRPLKNLQSP